MFQICHTGKYNVDYNLLIINNKLWYPKMESDKIFRSIESYPKKMITLFNQRIKTYNPDI